MTMTIDLMGWTTIKKPLLWRPLYNYNESYSQTAPLVTWSVVMPALQLSAQIVADLRCSGMFSIRTFSSPPASRPQPQQFLKII